MFRHPADDEPSSSSIVDELFASQIITGRVCDVCHHLSINIEPSYVLTLPLLTSHVDAPVSLESCLSAFGGVEQLDSVHCARCHPLINPSGSLCLVGGRDLVDCLFSPSSRGCQSQRRSMLRYCPPYLIIHLLRFNSQHSKRTCPVSVPRRLLLGNDVVIGDADVTDYELCSLCCHVDSHVIGSGHYVTYATLPAQVTWYRFDDVTVTRVDIDHELESDALRQNVYLIFYRRRHVTH